MTALHRLPTTEELIERYGEPDCFADDEDGPDNADRIGWAMAAVEAFCEQVYHRPEEQHPTFNDFLTDGDDDRHTYVYEVLGDLIADLLHVASAAGADPDAVISSAMSHFTAEVGTGYEGVA